ncbi:hypothetical protein BV509_06950 [Rhodovulum sulfidophilum]|uniref:DUF6314 domain-containing protein n=1 Tax=Rhodovulum visakhapatnamense TaxID=364297 RepID=A0ABS1RJD8_9RHOB|nr:hypothetical protein [Rhodovulum visakhapatnamense]MBL3579756.1 hypothetical protein [Rhodovulum visakhapatnamense]OLS44099.1 hypothetical protein BV509_06950 [Rhodovulum sulfidophilum]
MPELEDFEGAWLLTRRIDDRLTGQVLRLTGRAVFAPDDAGLVYDETGRLELPGQAPAVATRRYLWRAGVAGIEVFFEDGRFFHALGPGDRPEARHDCAPDLYRVRYDFAAWPCWSSRWDVHGPRKNYAMESEYRPES